MPDNTELNSGTGGDIIATDLIAGVKHQRVKVQHGADGSATDVSAASPLPVDGSNVTQPVSAAALPLPSGAATSAKQLADGHNVANAGTFAVQINNSNLVSTDNSSSTPLTGDATFTGTGEDISSYAAVSIQVFASHASATDGLSMEFSTDNSNWDEKHLATIAATTSREFTFPSHAKFFRVVYTNNSTEQTSFRLQTILHVQTLNGTSHALDENACADDVGILTKAVTIAQAAGTGDFVPVQATAAGNLKVSIEEADTSASGLAKAEDAVHASGDTGVMALGVRTDMPASTAADGDYVPLLTSAEGGLWVENLPGAVDSGNSTTSTLLADAVFTGTGIDILEHQSITVILDASHDSAADGMQFEFSSDNLNWDYTNDFTYMAAGGGRIFQFGAFAQYFRIVYTNGGTGQTHFRVQTLLHHGTTLTTIHRLVDNAGPDRSAEIVKSAIIAQAAGSGDFVPVQATASGNFKMSIEEVDGAIAGGGTEAAAMRVTLANDSTGLLSVDDNGNSLTVDTDAGALTVDGSGVTQPVSAASLPLPSGAATSAAQLADGHNVAVNAALPAGTNLIGDVGISVRTSGGTTLYKNIDVDQTEDAIKASAGQLYWLHVMNLSASVLFLKIYDDTVANVIVGTTVPDLTFPIPTQGDTNGAGFVLPIPNGIAFGTAITIAATTGIADNDSGAPGANECVVNAGYA